MGKVVLPVTRKKIYRGVSFSLGTVVLFGLLAFFFQKQIGISIWLGGMLWFLPELYVAYRLFHRIETAPKRAMISFYQTEITKLLLVAFLFVLIIKVMTVNILWLILGYLLAQIVFFMRFL